MNRQRGLKVAFYVALASLVFLLGYKAYLNFVEPDFQAVHAEQVDTVQNRLDGQESFRFVVVGNINNSVGIFERRMIPLINLSDADFLISAGNAVSGGGEDKYRALYRTLGRLSMPYLLTFGEHEQSEFGSFRFYEHFGPYFYAFSAGNAQFIFLDSTGKTPLSWQLRWLDDELAGSDAPHTFVFISHPPLTAPEATWFDDDDYYRDDEAFRTRFMELMAAHEVDAVFSANRPLYDHQQVRGTHYITTGGAGGLVMNNDRSFYHYVRVAVAGDELDLAVKELDIGQYPVFKTLESLWFFVHSLFYAGYLNFLLLVSALALVVIKLYGLIFVERDYYRDYDIDPAAYLEQPLRVAMFTNNYLPFIGGVPISIDRLRRGLRAQGSRVLVVAPAYGRDAPDGEDELRLPAPLAFGQRGEFRVANPLVRGTWRKLRAFAPDIVHVHHPFWLGSLGLWFARRLRVPVVYTYHTRLEHYAHYVPLPSRLFRNLLSHWLIRRFSNKCDGVIVPTISAEEYLRAVGVRCEILIQPTGIDYRRFRDADPQRVEELRRRYAGDDATIFVSASRLSREKNVDFMLDAVAALRRSSSRAFRLLLIGDGHERERLQERIDSLGLGDTVILVGAVPQDDMAAYYHVGDAFVFTSKSETQGMVILEAMAAGLPIVAVRSSGIDDVVQHGRTGYKTPENVGRFCACLRELLDDPARRAELAANARGFARGYDVEPFAREVRHFYAKLLARHAGAHKHKARGGRSGGDAA